MCLDRILSRNFPDPNLESDAYKVFSFRHWEKQSEGKLEFRFEPWQGSMIVPMDRWIESEERGLSSFYGGTSYTSGFHVYPTSQLQNLLDRWGPVEERLSDFGVRILPIKVRMIHTVGMQEGLDVWVAKEMFLSSTAKTV